MKFSKHRKSFLMAIVSIFTVTLLSACGGSGDSSDGVGSYSAGSSTITGNVSNGVAYQRSIQSEINLMAAVYDVIIPQAHAAGVAGVTVELYLDGVKMTEQATDANGNFVFDNLSPGNYNIQVVQGGVAMGKSPVIQLDANTNTKVGMNVNGGLMGVEVEARNTTISGEVEDDQNSNDDDRNDDNDSNDNDSNDRNDDNDSNDSNDDQNSNDNDQNDDQNSNDVDCLTASCDDKS